MDLLPKQQDFIFDLKTNQLAYLGGYGCGKTFALSVKAIILSGYNAGCAGMLVSPTFPMMRDTTRRTLFEILENEEIGFTFKATENKIIFNETHSEVWFRSADDPTKLKGSNLAWVGLDEPALMSKDAYDICLARLRDNKASAIQLFITGTHEGYSWVYDVFENEGENKRMIRSATDENIYLPKQYINSLYENYDEQMIRQYVKGYATLLNRGQVYYSFDRNANLTDVKFNPDKSIFLCVDFNVNPMCWAIVQKIDGVDFVVDEIVLPNSNTETASRVVREKYPHANIFVYGDYSGNQRSTNSQTTDFEIMRQIINPIEFRIQPNPLVINRINAVNARLKNAKGERKLFVNRDCKTTIRDFERVTYKEGRREIDKSNLELTHISDAIGYYIEYEYSLKGKTIGWQK